MDNQKIGQYIAYKRKQQGMTQKQLAEALLVTNKAVSKWETGTSLPDVSLLKDLAHILNVTVDELLNGEDALEKENSPKYHYQTITMTKALYKDYFQQMYYDHSSLFVISIIGGCLCICGGLAIYLLNRYLQHHFDVIGLFMMMVGMICLVSVKGKQFLQLHFYKSKDIQYQMNSQTFDYIQDGRKISYFYQDIQNIWIFETFFVFNIQNKKFYMDIKDLDMIQQHSSPIIHERITQKEKIILWVKTVSLLIFILLVCLELGYVVILKRLGFEYFFDVLEWYVIVTMLISLYISLTFGLKQWTRQNLKVGCLSFVIFYIVLWLVGNQISSQQTYYSLSPDLSSQLVLKQDKTTGQVKDLHYTFLCFGKANGIYDANGQSISTQWLNGDNNLVVYYDHEGKRQVHVATYGDRGDGISYYYVVSTLSGNWMTQDNKDKNYAVSVENGTVEINDQGETSTFNVSQIEQFGTTALACYDDYGNPCYVIAMNKDCELNDDGLVSSDGTITIINLNDMVPVDLFCTTYKSDPLVQQQIDDDMEERAKSQINDMKKTLLQNPTLKNFENSHDLFKIETTSEDFFEIVRLAYQMDIGSQSMSGYKSTDQINNIEIKAGTLNDFYVEVTADTWMENEATGKINENGHIPRYRMIQGEGCYLVRKMEYRVPGDVYLVPLSSPLEKDVSNDLSYRFERG